MTTNQAILLLATFRGSLPTEPRRATYAYDMRVLRARGLINWSDDDATYTCTADGDAAVNRMLNAARG